MAKQRFSKKRRKVEHKLIEEPMLLDDPNASPLEDIEFELPERFEAVRRNESEDPWSRPGFASENDSLTERRRRKMEDHSLNVEDESKDDEGRSVA